MSDVKLPPTAVRAAPEDPRALELRKKLRQLQDARYGGDRQKLFDAYDKNANRALDKEEVTRMLGDAGVGNGLTRGLWADGMIDRLDTNKDRAVDWAEFQNGAKT